MMNRDNQFDTRAAFINEIVTSLLKSQGPPDTVRQIAAQVEARVNDQRYGVGLTTYWDGITEAAFKAWIASEVEAVFREIQSQVESQDFVVYSVHRDSLRTHIWTSRQTRSDIMLDAWRITAPNIPSGDPQPNVKLETAMVGIRYQDEITTCIAIYHRGQRFAPAK